MGLQITDPPSVTVSPMPRALFRFSLSTASIFGVDHQIVDLAHIVTLAIDHRLGSGRLTAPPRPVVSTATAEEQNQYDY